LLLPYPRLACWEVTDNSPCINMHYNHI
jgi:hypothetical protein